MSSLLGTTFEAVILSSNEMSTNLFAVSANFFAISSQLTAPNFVTVSSHFFFSF